jgi:hypothetical protein
LHLVLFFFDGGFYSVKKIVHYDAPFNGVFFEENMAQPEFRGVGGGQPNIVPAEQVAGGDRKALEPRKGRPTWSDIQGWHKEGLGRVIGAADFYALRYSTGNPDWRADRVLLLFPDTNDLCLVGPRESTAQIQRVRDAENEGYRSDFTAIFAHAPKPYRHPSWFPATGISTYGSFLESASAFSVVPHKILFLDEEREAAIEKALAHERKLKERQRVQTLGRGEVLEGVLDLTDVAFLAGLGKELALDLERKEEEQLRAGEVSSVDSEVVVTLYEDLHRLERGEEL